ncbi:MAG TPA: NRDE family protein [Solimonas sp.]|nr:NRDE family protein [Solimonas sp.]
MCLIAVALDAHPRYRLVLAANRDEFHARPAAPASWWDDAPQIFGGRDLQQHGSWLAINRAGHWAAITNVRRMVPPDPQAPSRGALVADYLRGTQSAVDYARVLQARPQRHAGYNLLLGDRAHVVYSSNTPQPAHRTLSPGVHAVSNASLDTPWPKLLRLRQALADWCAAGQDEFAPLFHALSDTRSAADAELPDTGVGLEMERFLAPPFIYGERYGTRCCTVLALDHDGRGLFHERRFGPNAAPQGETRERLELA